MGTNDGIFVGTAVGRLVGEMVGTEGMLGGTVGYGRVGFSVSCTTTCLEGYGVGELVGLIVVGMNVGVLVVGMGVGLRVVGMRVGFEWLVCGSMMLSCSALEVQ